MNVVHSATILVVAPQHQERQECVNWLKISFRDCVVLDAETGAAGLAAYRSQRVDCIVVGGLLPDMALHHLIVELASLARHPGIAIIVLSPQPGPPMAPLVLSDGSRVFIGESRTSHDDLEKTINKALAL